MISANGTKTLFASGFKRPEGLAYDTKGTLFLSERDSGTIWKFAADGSKTAFATGLDNPFGLTFDAGGNLFLAEHCEGASIFRYAPDGTRSVVATDLSSPTSLAILPTPTQKSVPTATTR